MSGDPGVAFPVHPPRHPRLRCRARCPCSGRRFVQSGADRLPPSHDGRPRMASTTSSTGCGAGSSPPGPSLRRRGRRGWTPAGRPIEPKSDASAIPYPRHAGLPVTERGHQLVVTLVQSADRFVLFVGSRTRVSCLLSEMKRTTNSGPEARGAVTASEGAEVMWCRGCEPSTH